MRSAVHIWQLKKAKSNLGLLTVVTVSLALAISAKAEDVCGKLGELRNFHLMAADMLARVAMRDFASAENRIVEFETAWALAEPDLRHRDEEQWSAINYATYSAISALQRARPNQMSASKAVTSLVETLKRPCPK